MITLEKALIKPHHYIDIIKLYGAGIETFVPDRAFNHDFYRIGNLVLNHPNLPVSFTKSADDMCSPCKFRKGVKCSDQLTDDAEIKSKETWNQIIDSRLYSALGLSDELSITSLNFCMLLKNKLSEELIRSVWRERPETETVNRIKFTLLGIQKYLNRYKNASE